MLPDFPPNRHRLIGDTALNILGQLVPMLIGVASLPFIIRGLGPDRFGLFSLALAVLGTFGLLDLGMPRATTKFLAECLGQADIGRFTKTFWTSLSLQALLGAISGGLLLLLIPWLAGRVLKAPGSLAVETHRALQMIAFQIPFVMLTSSIRGALEAGNHFRATNALKALLGTMMYIIPVIALMFGAGLVGILSIILQARILITGLHLFFCIKVYPALLHFATDARLIRPLLAFGGSVLVANMVSTALISIDRFFIGAIKTTREVGFYSAPVDALSRLLILPISLVTVLFPMFSSLAVDNPLARDNDQHLSRIFAQSNKFLMLLMAPLAMFFVIFARPILLLWLGPEFAAQSTGVFKLASIAVLMSSLAWIPTALLQALGRPDLPAKFMLLETPFIVGLLWILIHRFGLVGAAVAWLVRAVAEVSWLFWSLWQIRPGVFKGPIRESFAGVLSSIVVLLLISWAVISSALDNRVFIQVTVFAVLLSLYGWVCWSRLLEPSERILLLSLRWRTVR